MAEAGQGQAGIEEVVEEQIEEKQPFPLANLLLFSLYLAIVIVLGSALVLSLTSSSVEARNLAPTLVTALTTIAGFAVGVNAAPKASQQQPSSTAPGPAPET